MPLTNIKKINFKTVPIVGIGASAGGLEAFKELLRNLPIDTGMAFIFVQHLDPTRDSLIHEILSRITKMPVIEVKDGMKVKPNLVYVIPANYNMTYSNRALNLRPRSTNTRGQHMVIDAFFKSLARQHKAKTIGVILSGTANDGTNGLKAIKAQGGLTIAQDPASTSFSGMPNSAIASGAVDLILTPKEVAYKLAQIAKNPHHHHGSKKVTKVEPGAALNKIFALLQTYTHIDFSNYKHPTIKRRILRQMQLKKSKSIEHYAKFLDKNPDEVSALYTDILINVTEFFRDSDSFKALKDKVFTKLIEHKTLDLPIRIWVPGCSTGEEVYSLAIMWHEFLNEKKINIPIQIFATDISDQVIQRARAGVYSSDVEHTVGKERLNLFFKKVTGGYKINKEIRDICLFSNHDLTKAPPLSKIDLISCRNVLIYFDATLQKRVIPLFHYALNPNGILWLGKAEGPGGFSKLFSVIDKTHKIFAKTNIPTPMTIRLPLSSRMLDIHAPIYKTSKKIGDSGDLQKEVIRVSLAKYAPPSVIINADYEILQFQGRIVPYLEPVSGLPSNNLFKMARPELLYGLRAAIQSAMKKNVSARQEGLSFEVDDKRNIVNIEVVPVNPIAPLKRRNFIVFFESVSSLPASKKIKKTGHGEYDKRISQLKEDLVANKQSQKLMAEEYEVTKEELQSSNEELNTVNDELQNRNSDLIVLSSDLNNILNSIELAIVIIGNNRRIRRFTPKAEKIFNLNSSDIGRHLSDIKPNFELSLNDIATEVITSLALIEREIKTQSGHWMRLQIRPYKTIDNKIDGVVITLVDIVDLKEQIRGSQKAQDYLISVAEAVRHPLVILDNNSKLISANRAFWKDFNFLQNNNIDEDFFANFGLPNDVSQNLRLQVSNALIKNKEITDIEITINTQNNNNAQNTEQKKLLISARPIMWQGEMLDKLQEHKAILISLEDITERNKLGLEKQLLAAIVTDANDAIISQDIRGVVLSWNQAAEKILGYSAKEMIGQNVSIIIPPKYRGEETDILKKVAHGERSEGFQTKRRCKDGKIIDVLMTTSLIKTSNDTIIGSSKVIRDITESRALEFALEESEERFRTVIDSAHDAIITINSQGIIELVNEQVLNYFGYTKDELVGQTIEKLIPERLRNAHVGYRERYNIQAKPRTMGQGLELFARRKDGRELPVDISLSPMKLRGEIKVTAIIRDISERKKLMEKEKGAHAAAKLAQDVAERANEAKDIFLAILSHELRTPLTSILSWSQLMQRQNFNPDKLTHGLEVIEQSAKSQGQLIDDLLDITRIQSGKLATNFAEVSPDTPVKYAIEAVSVLAEKKKITIELEIKIHTEIVWGDTDRMQQIVWNLLTNAIKFSADGSTITIRIEPALVNAKSYVSIKIIDQGKGIQPDFLPKLFKRFSQADSSSIRTYGGLGLGLSIVSDLVSLHGGTVSAESKGLGSGATFTVLLPVMSDKQSSATKKVDKTKYASEKTANKTPNLAGIKVMIVEDEPKTLDVLVEAISSYGAKIIACKSAAEALTYFKEFKPDILLSDIAMPGEDGYSLIKKIRLLEKEYGGNIPSLALTAYAAESDIKTAISAGFNSHMAKPFDTQLLGHELARLVNSINNKSKI
ncbi:MAG: hypothetical protein A2Z20_06140 [Bdellovibrionales bacterium RBG_16_40_8]|nr:MAG: hypothetical protein A2Z20_06140 [Bdellovibrionales bacterium RBG_16_40_8]